MDIKSIKEKLKAYEDKIRENEIKKAKLEQQRDSLNKELTELYDKCDELGIDKNGLNNEIVSRETLIKETMDKLSLALGVQCID